MYKKSANFFFADFLTLAYIQVHDFGRFYTEKSYTRLYRKKYGRIFFFSIYGIFFTRVKILTKRKIISFCFSLKKLLLTEKVSSTTTAQINKSQKFLIQIYKYHMINIPLFR